MVGEKRRPWGGRDTITSFEGAYITRGAKETEALGERLGRTLAGGTVVALCGPLGSGKTTFVRGLGRGLGVEDPGTIRSPSYTLVLRYEGSPPLRHLDAYFMRREEDLLMCGLEDALAAGEAVVVEWADRLTTPLPEPMLVVRFEHVDPETRRIHIGPLEGGTSGCKG